MAEAVRFQTRARTIDHLGREQIADCPTAISELWKNSYDAYARTVSLHIFDGEPTVACICDDGHGMSRDEFVNKWLVIGTESKAVGGTASPSDRDGLPYRRRQGKKGIGRLSAAYLANFFLLITKRRNEEYVAALIDWRIFENPFLVLDDIRIPVTTFENKNKLFQELPRLYDTMMSNVWGDPMDRAQQERVKQAWKEYDELELASPRASELFFSTTSSEIEKTLINEIFKERHLSEWEVWTDFSSHGTAMIMSGVIPEIDVLLRPKSLSASDGQSIRRFRDTLWCFVDPFTTLSRRNEEPPAKEFSTRVISWRGDTRDPIIEHGAGFESQSVDQLEHIIDGEVDENGVFKGRVKAFGVWIDEEVKIDPAEKVSQRSDSRTGKFAFYIAAMEFDPSKSTHTGQEFLHFLNLLDQFHGLMVFRDGFRVMPYGRADADYFGIERRRGLHAGREFWDHHNMLGRIAISDLDNPNLKDKAGREGIIDNRASKTFRSLVIHILMTTARRYFGTDSQLRKETLPILKEAYKKKKREEERLKLAESNKKKFFKNLKNDPPSIIQLRNDISQLKQSFESSSQSRTEEEVISAKELLSDFKQRRAALRLGPPPEKLAPKVKVVYESYRENMQAIESDIRELEDSVVTALDVLKPADPVVTVQNELENCLRRMRRRLVEWEKKVGFLLDSEKNRVHEYAIARRSQLEQEIAFLVDDVRNGTLGFREAIALIDKSANQHDLENSTQFEGVIETLENLSENINLNLLANITSDELGSLRSELDRLNSLAQLGITVEVIDHELASFSSTIGYGLKSFPPNVINSRAYHQVKDAYDALASRLRFLSPLKLSGEAEYRKITGADIIRYAKDFFRSYLETKEFKLESTEAFDYFSVMEQPARIFPVFINLINNSRYWVQQNAKDDREILLCVRGEKVIVADNGPGISEKDVGQLFRLFFTNREGGRGVGLYLCRSNLAAGGHKISYATERELRPLSGANFVIEFREASFPK